jgi:hypothetical protein
MDGQSTVLLLFPAVKKFEAGVLFGEFCFT